MEEERSWKRWKRKEEELLRPLLERPWIYRREEGGGGPTDVPVVRGGGRRKGGREGRPTLH